MYLEQLRSADLCSLRWKTGTLREPEPERAHNQIVTVTGVTGVGKGYLLTKTLAQIDGDMMLRMPSAGTLLAEHFRIHRDEIRTRVGMEEYQKARPAIQG
jgi:adenylate kinase